MESPASPTKKRRLACDACHKAKVRCSGESICSRCQRDSITCHYSQRAHIGKPKGSLNKSTIERLKALGQMPAPAHDQSCAQSATNHAHSDENCISLIDILITPPGTSASDTLPTTPGLDFPSTDVNMTNFDDTDSMDTFLSSLHTPYNNYITHGNMSSNDDCFYTDGKTHDPLLSQPPQAASTNCKEHAFCSCIRFLTAQVNNLYATLSSRSPSGLDETLGSTQEIASCISAFLQCHACSCHPQAFFIVNVVLSMTLDLILPFMDSSEQNPRSRTQIRVGNLSMSGQLGMVLEKVVVQSMIRNLQGVVEKFETKIDFLSSDTAHLEFLKYEARRLKRGLERVAV